MKGFLREVALTVTLFIVSFTVFSVTAYSRGGLETSSLCNGEIVGIVSQDGDYVYYVRIGVIRPFIVTATGRPGYLAGDDVILRVFKSEYGRRKFTILRHSFGD